MLGMKSGYLFFSLNSAWDNLKSINENFDGLPGKFIVESFRDTSSIIIPEMSLKDI